MKTFRIHPVAAGVSLLLSLASGSVLAADLQGAKTLEAPKLDNAKLPAFQPTDLAEPPVGGPKVKLRQVQIGGNPSIGTDALLAVLGPVADQEYDANGLYKLARTVANHYKAQGFIFAQAYLPPQDLATGVLRIQVIEGQYGKIEAAGADDMGKNALPFVQYVLRAGDPIVNKPLERALLITDDLPGIKIQPILRPGAQQGQSDLMVNVAHDEQEESGDWAFDNLGPRSTGEYRLKANFHGHSTLTFGDRASFSGLVTDRGMWLGSLNYELPVGYSGLRAAVGYSRSSYTLGDEFSSLGAHGLANTITAQLNHPVVRTQASNLMLSYGWQHKSLKDYYDTVTVQTGKASNSLVLGARFDRRDQWLGGGVSYGTMTFVNGNLHLDSRLLATDAVTARTADNFSKFNLDLARIQSLSENWSLFGRVSGQWSNKNLDSSEKFNLGGFYGVRAHPLGEGTGDKGYLGQIELRYAVKPGMTPFVFYDAGRSHVNFTPWDIKSDGVRVAAGYGLGLRYIRGAWSMDMTLAQQGHGGASTSDTQNRNPRFFFLLGKRF